MLFSRPLRRSFWRVPVGGAVVVGCVAATLARPAVVVSAPAAACVPLHVVDDVSAASLHVGGDGPYRVAVDSTTNRIYVIGSGPGANDFGQVGVFDASTNSLITTIPLNAPFRQIVADPTNGHIYVSEGPTGQVAVIDELTNQIVRTIPVPNAFAMAVDPTRNLIYVTQSQSGSLAVIDGSTDTVTRTIVVDGGYPTEPEWVAVNPITNRIYTSSENTFAGKNKLYVIDGANGQIVNQVFANPPDRLAVDPAKDLVYAVVYGTPGTDGSNSLNRLDVFTGDATAPPTQIDLFAAKSNAGIWDLGVDSTDARVYVLAADIIDYNGWSLYQIDEATNAVTRVPVGHGTLGLAANATNGHVYLADSYDASLLDVSSGACSNGDTTPPTVTLGSPADGAVYNHNDNVISDFSCADDGGLALTSPDNYVYYYCVGNGGHTGSQIDTTSAGTKSFTVTAKDETGNSAIVTHTYTVQATTPQAPAGVTATAGDSSASVSWFAPDDGGSPISGYTVTSSPGGQTATAAGDATTATVSGLTNGVTYTFTVTATNSVGTGPPSDPSNPVTPQPAGPPAGTVTRSGTTLLLDGQPFRPIGLNIYNANSNGSCWYDMAHGSTLDDALNAIGPGKNVIRAWFFQSLATANGQRDWSAFDHTLSVARAHGFKVMATLANQWADCEPAAGYKSETWYTSGYKAVDPGGTVSYRDWVQEVAARYKNDPTVLAWQLVNEPEILPQKGGDCSTVPESTAVNVLSSFAADVSGAIKSVDPNHLISLGTIGNGQCGAQGGDYKTVMSTPTLDLCEFHDYTPSQLVPGDQFNGMQVRINQCNAVQKPLLVGELGVKPSDVGNTFTARANVIASKLCAQLTAGVAGELLWAWDKDGSLLDNFDIGPSDPVLDVLSPWSDPSHTCSRPSAPTSVVAAAGDSSASVSWNAPAAAGGSPIISYTVTASPGGASATTNGSTTTATVPGLTNGSAYTFTVTASNAAGTSDPSAASSAVTPLSGNTAATGIASPSASTTVATGDDPAATGGTTSSVTVPSGTSGGAVTVTQTAPNQTAPSGYVFGGVQVDITAPSATATNPLTLVFTMTPPVGQPLDQTTLGATNIYRAEGAGSPTLVPDCTVAGQALPDGSACVSSRQYVTVNGATDIRLTVSTAAASHWNSARPKAGAVSVGDKAYSPSSVTVQPGAQVKWAFTGAKAHSVTDATGLGAAGAPWFNSGARNSGSYSFTFPAAGSFAYKSTVKGDSMTGTVVVPVVVTPGKGAATQAFSVIWSTNTLPGYLFDVQYRFKPAGSSAWKGWMSWKSGVSTTSATFVPSQGNGIYAFHARLRNNSTGRASGYSTDTTITVS